MKPALSTTSLRSHTISEAIEAAVRLHYAGIEIWAEHLWDRGEDPASLGSLAKSRGLVVSVHGPSRDLNVTSANKGIREESRRQYYQALEDAVRLGARVIAFHPGSMSSSRDRPQDYWDAQVQFFTAIGKAASGGIRIGIENMEDRAAEFVTHPRDVARLIDAARSDTLGLTLDIAHMLYNRKPIDLAGLEQYIAHVHLSGSTETLVHVPLAEGIYDLRPPLMQLKRFYTGVIAFEGYARGREMETVEENRRMFERLLA